MKLFYVFKIAFASFLLMQVVPAAAQTAPMTKEIPDCSVISALSVAKTDAEVAKFCSSPVNGVSNGCNFIIRPADSREKNSPWIAWIVQASIIHSFDEKGQPRFMPEGAIFAYLSKSCEISGVLWPFKCNPRKGSQSCPH